MNRPGTVNGDNWKWKLEQPLTLEQAHLLRGWTEDAGRQALNAVSSS
jgi:4-alpha-glucanotransferase